MQTGLRGFNPTACGFRLLCLEIEEAAQMFRCLSSASELFESGRQVVVRVREPRVLLDHPSQLCGGALDLALLVKQRSQVVASFGLLGIQCQCRLELDA